MKLPTTLVNRGFLLPEIMIAFSLMTLFLVSALALTTTMQRLHDQAVEHLTKLEMVIENMSSSTMRLYGNDSIENFFDPLTLLTSDYANAWGRDSCSSRFSFNPTNVFLYAQGVDLGAGNVSTDLEVRNNIAYLTADSATASAPDFYIIDMRDPGAPVIMSSLNTGPGLSALEVAGHYVYTTNLGSTNQLQVIDISNRLSPVLVTKLKLPLPNASSTAPSATSIFYSKSRVYLGTEKWEGTEFAVVDVSQPSSPQHLGGFETNTLVNDIYMRDERAYLANSDIGQMRILNVHDPTIITEIGIFSPTGYATQEGKVLSYFEEKFGLGRTTGGFNVLANPEAFLFSTTSPVTPETSHDIPGGVYGMLLRPPFIYLATRSPGHEFQVWKSDFSEKIFEKALGFLPQRMTCDGQTLYFATGDRKGVAVLKIN